jgi:hypothetical protein
VKLTTAAPGVAEVELDWRGRRRPNFSGVTTCSGIESAPTPWSVVVVRNSPRKEPDDFFFTTDLAISLALVVEIYAVRWSIEMCFREVRQGVAGQEPQSSKGGRP